MTDKNEDDMLAAEYVLGTLEAADRTDVAVRRSSEPDLDKKISEWEQRLSPLVELVEEVEPAPNLFSEIETKLFSNNSEESTSSNIEYIATNENYDLRKRLMRWKITAMGTSAIAASLAMFILFNEPLLAPQEQKFVAVFHSDDQPPAFILAIDLKTQELTIRPVTAKAQSGKTYQLWIASDKLGPSPRSLGLLDSPGTPTRKRLKGYDLKLLKTATFGISLEPLGGSPTGKPTGPAIHGKLLPTSL